MHIIKIKLSNHNFTLRLKNSNFNYQFDFSNFWYVFPELHKIVSHVFYEEIKNSELE